MHQHRTPSLLIILLSILVLPGLTGCSAKLEEMRERYQPSSAREAYIQGLEDTGIDDSAVAIEWLKQGEEALQSLIEPALPYREEGRLVATDIMAVGYRLSLRRGQQLKVEATAQGYFDVFIDVYELLEEEGLPPRRIASADSGGVLEVDIHRTRDLLLRIQPEILSEGSFAVTISNGRFPRLSRCRPINRECWVLFWGYQRRWTPRPSRSGYFRSTWYTGGGRSTGPGQKH